MEKKRSSVIPTMAVISLIIIVLGIICAAAFYSAVTHEIAQGADASLIVGGTDLVSAAGHAGSAGAAVLSVMIGVFSFVLVIVQWAAYLIIRVIAGIIKNRNNSNN